MQTVIVPVDFSETSLNATRYATKLLTGHYGVHMILHHVYEKASQAEEITQKLEELKLELREVGIVKTETLAEQGSDFLTELEKLARHRSADLIVMGITGRSAIGQTLIGSNTLKIVERKVCPVLIIPADSKYQDVKNVLLTSDFKNVVANTPSVPIKKLLGTLRPNLHVLNVDSSHYVALTEEYQAEKIGLQQMFAEFSPEFYFMGLHDIDEAISQFAEDKKIDIIIVIHREQSLFSRLFIKSHTKKLVYQSSIPVLAMHE
ncbi:MAG TPA: universal stress protein [Chitinophagaceae bacterium]|nr:universal stress protein [Chitinophagaceae bacterium]